MDEDEREDDMKEESSLLDDIPESLLDLLLFDAHFDLFTGIDESFNE
jgi:hypothetical protein